MGGASQCGHEGLVLVAGAGAVGANDKHGDDWRLTKISASSFMVSIGESVSFGTNVSAKLESASV